MDPKNAVVGDLFDETSLSATEPASPMLEGALALDTDGAQQTDEKGVTREQRRSRRKRDVRARTRSLQHQWRLLVARAVDRHPVVAAMTDGDRVVRRE